MQKITIGQARVNCNFSPKVVAEHLGISVKRLKKLESNSGRMQYDLVVRLLRLYGISMDHVYFGPAENVYNGEEVSNCGHC
ncbi:hypothetical protein D3C87_1327850 [compost metagenome]